MNASWLAVLPPLIVIVIAAYTKRILFALLIGIMAGSFIVADGCSIDAFNYGINRFWRLAQLNRLTSWDGFWSCSCLFVLIFFLLLGILIIAMRRSGATHAFGTFAKKRIKTARGAESAALIMSGLFATIDDYFVSMTLGSVMQPITDQFGIPRAKIAVLVGIIAAPMSMLLPCPSWVAELIGVLRSAGVSEGYAGTLVKTDPLALYFSSIPFMLYAIVIVVITWYMTTTRISYGIIARQELYAAKTGEQFGGKLAITPRHNTDASEEVKKNSRLSDFLFPIITLYLSTISTILWSGGWWLFNGPHSFTEALQNTQIFFSFAAGGFCTVIASMIYYVIRKQIRPNQVVGIICDGFLLISGAMMMLWFIWVFSSIIRDDLKTGSFLAELMMGQVSPSFFPLMFFMVAALISTVIGRAWGTIGILIPLGFEMLPSFLGLSLPVDLIQVPMLSALVGAIVSGAVVGKHLSPVADSTIMASTIVGCYHLDLVKSQVQLALPSFIASLFGYYVVGLTINIYGSMPSAVMGLAVALTVNFIIIHLLYWLSQYQNRHRTRRS